MALTRGQSSNFPCTVCLIPKTELANYSTPYVIRTTQHMKDAVATARAQPTLTLGERILAKLGLRNVDVCHSF